MRLGMAEVVVENRKRTGSEATLIVSFHHRSRNKVPTCGQGSKLRLSRKIVVSGQPPNSLADGYIPAERPSSDAGNAHAFDRNIFSASPP